LQYDAEKYWSKAIVRKVLQFVFLLLISTFSWFSTEAAENTSNRYSARVVHIIDGDTFEVQKATTLQRIRLWGIDTPEWDQPYAKEAKRYLKEILYKQIVVVAPLYVDSYGRVVAKVFLRGTSVNRDLVEKGYAWVHVFFCKEEICKSWKNLEKNARRKKIGLWGEGQAIAPWHWKRINRKE
jgi:micrococcal nuclease